MGLSERDYQSYRRAFWQHKVQQSLEEDQCLGDEIADGESEVLANFAKVSRAFGEEV